MLTQEESEAILRRQSCGVLALLGDEDYPYAVPMSYVYDGSAIYFHGAVSGHKVDAMKKCGKASFCVVDQDQVVPEEFTTYYRSVIVFGRIRVIGDETEKRQAAEKLAVKYSPKETEESLDQEIRKGWNALCMMELSVEHMTGKECIELVRKKGQ